MFDARRPKGRLFYLVAVLAVLVSLSFQLSAFASRLAGSAARDASSGQPSSRPYFVSPPPQGGPAMTTVSDTIYRADGTPAQGTLVISWPAFITAGGTAVAAGRTNVTLGAQGALSVALVPNAGSNPAGVYYTVVYQLSDNTVKTEFWSVPTSSPANLATVRTTPGSGTAAQPVSMQYVNTALATKANDSSVVHLSGSETIAGAKTFSTAPNVPAPVNTGDVANKAYVDTSIANVGAGNYLPSAGGTMTGPLTLSGNPASALQAAPKQYVDSVAAVKADLISGRVPTGELGSGTVSASSCLLGNSTWGPCSSSTNAISIQSVPVASTAPTDGQVIAYSAASGQYGPAAGGGVTAGMQVVRWATDFNWSQSVSANLSTPGSQTATLSACPSGVTGSEPYYYIYIAGTGTPEAALVTGGTCAGNGASGTLIFTTVNSHPAGYTINSASSGLQESSIAARFTIYPGYYQGATVYAPAGEFPIYAKVSFRANGQTINFTHAIFDCYANDACLYVGDPSNANTTSNVTLIKPRGKPMVSGGTKPMIEVNGQATRLEDVATRFNNTGFTFGTIVQVDGDQSFTLDGLDLAIGLGTIACNATFCGATVTAPGPFSANPAVGHLTHVNISPQCDGNGVDWESGNTLEISDSVIQGYSQYGVRGGRALGGYGNIKMVNVYEEGGCSNPMGNIGTAGVIVNGGPVFWSGGEGPQGSAPTFANTGSTQWQYYLVARHATYGPSNLFYVGSALTNGTGAVTVTTADVPGAATFDLLKVQPVGGFLSQAPYGVGNYAVATNVVRSTACSNGVCTFTDTQAAPASYVVATPTYYPKLNFWPGGIVLGAWADGNSVVSAATLTIDVNDFSGEGTSLISVLGTHAPAVYANKCPLLVGSSPVWVSCVGANFPPETQFQQDALVMATKPAGDGGVAGAANLKGRLNFATAGSTAGHIITLVDSNFQKTVATVSNRPQNDANDSYIGIDQTSSNGAGISVGAALSISDYIGNVGDGTNWLERLTAGAKTFNVPVTINGNLTVTGTCTGCGGGGGGGSGTVSSASQSQVAVYSSSGTTVSGDSGLTDNGTILNYAGNGGITAAAGTFSGNVTVNGQLLVAGPWMVSSPIPGTAMPASGSGTSSLGISNDGNFYVSANGGSPQKVATTATSSYFSNLAQEDPNDLGEYNGTSVEGLNIYGTRTDASDYERLRATYDSTNNYYALIADYAGTGLHRGLGFNVNGSLRWVIDTLNTFKPWSDNVQDIGSATLRVRNGYFGTGVITPSLTLNGAALSGVIGTPSANLITAGTVSGTGQPLCTDGTGNLTITTVGCPPGTGTIGGSGTAPQFAYWTNTNGLGAAPLNVTNSNTVEQYNGTNVQTFNVYGTRTDSSNYERAGLAYVSADGYYELQSQQAGTGSQRGICFGVNNSCKWAVDITTAFKPFNDNSRDIGTSSLRVRDFYLGRNLIMSGTATSYNGKTTAGTGLAPIYGAVSLTGQTAAVSSTSLCASSTCGAGQYEVNYYIDSTVACTTAGSAAASLTIGWTDETNAKTLQVPLTGTGISGGNSMALGSTSNFGSGSISLWSAGSANIAYSSSYTGCTTGTGTYALRVAVRQLQ